MKKQYFNMVEVLLALGVVVIGICSVMVLFPVGVSANRDAAVLDDTSNTADQALHFIAYRFENIFVTNNTLWDENLNTIPENSSIDHEEITNNLMEPSNWITESNASEGIFQGTDFTDSFYQYKKNNVVYPVLQVIFHRNPKGVKFGDGNFNEELVDYRAIIVLTKSQLELDSSTLIPYSYGFRLKAEISWPAETPYSQRKIVNYSLDIYRNPAIN